MFNMSMISIAWHWLPSSPTNNPHHLTWMQLTGSGLRRNVGCNQEDASKQISQEMQAGYCTLDSRLVGGCEAHVLLHWYPEKIWKVYERLMVSSHFSSGFLWDQRINVSPPRRYKTPRVKWCWQATATSGRGYEGHMGSFWRLAHATNLLSREVSFVFVSFDFLLSWIHKHKLL